MSSTGMREPFPGFPPPLTTRPDGLLSLLGIQNNGRYPQHLAVDNLLPTLDLTRWYLESEQDFPTFTQLWGAALGFTLFMTVPEGESWIVLGGTAEYQGAIAAARRDCIVRANSTGGGIVALGDFVDTPAGQRTMFNVNAGATGWLLRPLTQVGLYAGIAAAAINTTLTMRVARLVRS